MYGIWMVRQVTWLYYLNTDFVVGSLCLMASHKKAYPFSGQAFFPGAHLCNVLSAIIYNLFIRKLFSSNIFVLQYIFFQSTYSNQKVFKLNMHHSFIWNKSLKNTIIIHSNKNLFWFLLVIHWKDVWSM